MNFRNWLMISSLVFLNACDCSGSKGEGCGLALAAAGGIIAAPIAAPIMWANQRSPKPQIESKNNRIHLEQKIVVSADNNYVVRYEKKINSARDNKIDHVDTTIKWQNLGAEKLSGSHIFDRHVTAATAVPSRHMAAVSIVGINGEQNKVLLLDLVSKQLKFEILVGDEFVFDTTASPDGNYLLIPSNHQIDIYDIENYNLIGSISTGAFFGRPIFEENKNRFATNVGSTLYIFSISPETEITSSP